MTASGACPPIIWMFASAVSDKDEESEDMSIPGSPQNEAIQHSSISTSNGVGSSSTTPAASALSTGATTSTQSTEEKQPRRSMAQAQPPGSWWSCSRAGWCFQSALPRGKEFALGFSSDPSLSFIFDESVASENNFSAINGDKRTGTLGVGCKILVYASGDVFIYCGVFI